MRLPWLDQQEKTHTLLIALVIALRDERGDEEGAVRVLLEPRAGGEQFARGERRV